MRTNLRKNQHEPNRNPSTATWGLVAVWCTALLVLAVLAVPAVYAQGAGDLVVTEFMANPAAVSDSDGEYVEIYNRTGTSYDLDGFRLRDDGSNDHPIGASVVVAPGAFVILARSADPMGDGSVTPDYVYSSFTLTNSADEIVLETGDGTEIFRLAYTDGDAGGAGVAMETSNVESAGSAGSAGQDDLVAASTQMPNGDFGSPGDFGDTVLPVELAAFAAEVDGRAVTLRWATASETDNAGFHVLHRVSSDAGAEWTALGFVGGAGTTVEAQSYRFATGPLAPGLHAFRLRQVDTDGTASLSIIRTVRMAGEAHVTLTGAHPLRRGASAGVMVGVEVRHTVRVALYNVLGQQVQAVYRGPVAPSQPLRLTIRTQDLAAGMYFLRVSGGVEATRKLVVF
jgi:hypothetical protein